MIPIRKHRPARYGICAAAVFIALSLAACSLAPRYERPGQDIPAQWRKVDIGPAPLESDWWSRFNDPALTALINEALRDNQDLAQSLAKIDSAAAQAGVAASALFPSVAGAGQAGAQSVSEKAPNSPDYDSPLTGMSRSTTAYQLGLSSAWELDLWGKYRNAHTYLTDVLLNTIVGHEALRLSLAGQTAQTYFAMLALDMQLDTARRTLKTREDALGIYSSRYKQGDITELDWLRARAEVETARAQLHMITIALDQAEAALAVLVGRSPRGIVEDAVERGKTLNRLPSPPVLPEGLPSSLLERRPDIRAAEYMLMAYNANIGVARAQFFPSISLTGALGTMSSAVSNLFVPAAGFWNYGVSGSLPILDFGRNWYNLKDAEAQKQAAVAVYRKTVQSAFKDIRNSLTAQREANAIVRSMSTQVDSLRRSVEIARLQYDNGYSDYLTVLDAERQLFSAELQLANALRDRLDSVVSVCMALGGGWQDPRVSAGFPVDADKLRIRVASGTRKKAAEAEKTP
ncbi:MAG: efflux transporter outer membrane subunit [Desulfovibrio sp.]|jgi:multidrug efflux system outer membrane protein|nr:efflux transporter outer membrane subunit [Desulfovibrio sp.]